MFRKIQQRRRDARTLADICNESERIANAEGQREPGAEHFVLAAFEMADGSARRAFERVGADPGEFRAAIDQQFADALGTVGLAANPVLDARLAPLPVPPGTGLYRSKPSVTALMKLLSDEEALQVPTHPLLGAHVVLAAAHADHSTAVRALRAMGIDPQELASAAAAEIRRHAEAP